MRTSDGHASPEITASRKPHSLLHTQTNAVSERANSEDDSSAFNQCLDFKPSSTTSVRLRDQVYKRIGRAAFDVCLAVIPCLFIYLGIAASLLDGQPESAFGSKIQELSRLGPTIYPIAFAAIVARFMRHTARWLAQRGQSLGILEQLIQSSSLAATAEIAFSLKAATLASLSIILVWALSPIGGQGSLRVLSVRDEMTTTPVGLTAPYGETMRYFGGLSHYVTTPIVINALISVSLAAPNSTTSSPRDTWGNVKLPASHYVADGEYAMAHKLSDNEGLLSNETEYSSLIGIPIWDVPQQGNTTFSFEWPVFDTDCHWEHNYTDIDYCKSCSGGEDSCFVNRTLETWITKYPEDCNLTSIPTNYTDLERCHMCEGGEDEDVCILNSRENGTVDGWPYGCQLQSENMRFTFNDLVPVNLTSSPDYLTLGWKLLVPTMGEEIIDDIYATTASCILKTTHVRADVFCADGICEVYKMRKSPTDDRPDFINPWNNASGLANENSYNVQGGMLDSFFEFLIASTGTPGFLYSATPLQNWLLGSSNPYKPTDSSNLNGTDWWGLTDADMSKRLTQIYNTMWLASQQSADIPARVTDARSALQNATTSEALSEYSGVDTTVTTSERVYNANYVWITLLVLISLVLFVCAIASLVLRLFITAPDILGFVSSLTRDNPYFSDGSLPVLQGGSIMSGPDRARAMRHIRVQIIDVRPEAEVGHVTLVPTDYHGSDKGQRLAGRVHRDRLYD